MRPSGSPIRSNLLTSSIARALSGAVRPLRPLPRPDPNPNPNAASARPIPRAIPRASPPPSPPAPASSSLARLAFRRASLTISPHSASISVARPVSQSCSMEDLHPGSSGNSRDAAALYAQSGSASTNGRNGTYGLLGLIPHASYTSNASSTSARHAIRNRRRDSVVGTGAPERALTGDWRLMSSLPYRTGRMSRSNDTASPVSRSASTKAARLAFLAANTDGWSTSPVPSATALSGRS
mmetsp:Transcript_4317/g.17690  ORF Transcript_4317/g.17690 Transcript_4317/m.17690 type:complete len:239 (-) Transcript_4317:611-1327(-)